jgi:hypothetical protein
LDLEGLHTHFNEGAEGFKTQFPLFGEVLFRATGPIVDRKRIRKLKTETPELFEIMKKERQKILDMLGVKDFQSLKGLSAEEKTTEAVRNRIADTMNGMLVPDFVENEAVRLKLSEIELVKLAKESDTVIKYILERFFPGSNNNPALGLSNEVENTHDVGELSLIALDAETWDPMVRFEAMRKLALVEVLAKIQHLEQERNEEHKDLSYFDKLLNSEGIYSLDHGRRKGFHQVKYLVSEHDAKTQSCTAVSIAETKERAREAFRSGAEAEAMHISPIALRVFAVKDDQGKPREIEGMIDSRVKTRLSILLKALRRNRLDQENVLKDLNGVRLVLENRDHVDWFTRSLKEKLLESGHKVEVTREKERVAKGGLSFTKFNINIDSRLYEMQIFTFKEWADYLHKRPYSWAEYEVNRFFDGGCASALFPEDTYGYLNLEKAREIATESAYKQAENEVWGREGIRNGKTLT